VGFTGVSPGANGLDAHQPHESRDSLAVNRIAFPPELGGDFADPVVGMLRVNLVDPVHESEVFRIFAFGFIVVARAANSQ